jgi:hypothetical protein
MGMAQMLPPHFPFPGDPKRRAESDVFDQFASLEDKWTVIYSLAWHGNRQGRVGDGEGDFILLHPNYGFFVAEVKGGQKVFLEDGEWFSTPHGRTEPVKIRDPFEQGLSTSKALDEFLRENFVGPRLPIFGHFVVLPGHIQHGDLSPAGKRELIMDKVDLATPLQTLQRLSNHWNRKASLSASDVEKVVKTLRPDVEFSIDKRVHIDHAQRGMKELTERQLTVLAAVRRQRRLLVNGTAGTGKTVLAVDAAKFHAQSGKKTLLLCFNRPLGEKLRQNLSSVPNLTIGSFHSFAKREVEMASIPFEDFDDIPYLLIEAATMNGTFFDAIVIDEAQDFKADWWEALLALNKDELNSIVHVFRDINQDIYEGESTPFLDTLSPVDLTLNCRNTLPIAQLVHDLGNIDTQAQSVDGPKPEFLTIGSRSGAEKKVKELIDRWVNEAGLTKGDITVLTDSADLADDWFGHELNGVTLGDGTRGSIHIETIQRFKGLESEAIICIFDPENEHKYEVDDMERIGYIGFSRAKTLLTILGPEAILKQIRK